MGRADPFAADPGLQARMAAAAVLTPLLVLAVALLVALLLPLKITLAIAASALVGAGVAVRARRRRDHAVELGRDEAPHVHDAVDRLALAADVERPVLVLDRESAPNSWVVDLPGRAPRLHVTQGLLDALTPDELEAVLAHEIAHVAHRDASVMSVVGLPGDTLLEGGLVVARMNVLPIVLGGVIAGAIGGLSRVGTSALSRYRETAADAAAARLTGKPAALASALRKVSGEIARIPADDLRTVGHAAFNLVPVAVERKRWAARAYDASPLARLTATHPSTAARIAALEQLERRMHAARVRPDLV